MIMIPTDRPVRSVERKRLTISLRVPPFQGGARDAMPQAFHPRVDHDKSGYHPRGVHQILLAMMLV